MKTLPAAALALALSAPLSARAGPGEARVRRAVDAALELGIDGAAAAAVDPRDLEVLEVLARFPLDGAASARAELEKKASTRAPVPVAGPGSVFVDAAGSLSEPRYVAAFSLEGDVSEVVVVWSDAVGALRVFVPPRARNVAFAVLEPCTAVAGYVALFFDGDRLLAFPAGVMTPALAARLNPADRFACLDSWLVANPG